VQRPPILLVLGGWVWRRVRAPLRAAGHEVHALMLTGDGERAHMRTPYIGLETHVATCSDWCRPRSCRT
jgi:hypothetical protein